MVFLRKDLGERMISPGRIIWGYVWVRIFIFLIPFSIVDVGMMSLIQELLILDVHPEVVDYFDRIVYADYNYFYRAIWWIGIHIVLVFSKSVFQFTFPGDALPYIVEQSQLIYWCSYLLILIAIWHYIAARRKKSFAHTHARGSSNLYFWLEDQTLIELFTKKKNRNPKLNLNNHKGKFLMRLWNRISRFRFTKRFIHAFVEPATVVCIGVFIFCLPEDTDFNFGIFLIVSAIALCLDELFEAEKHRSVVLNVMDGDVDGQRTNEEFSKLKNAGKKKTSLPRVRILSKKK